MCLFACLPGWLAGLLACLLACLLDAFVCWAVCLFSPGVIRTVCQCGSGKWWKRENRMNVGRGVFEFMKEGFSDEWVMPTLIPYCTWVAWCKISDDGVMSAYSWRQMKLRWLIGWDWRLRDWSDWGHSAPSRFPSCLYGHVSFQVLWRVCRLCHRM